MRLLRELYIQVLIGIAIGIVVGVIWPEFGASLKFLGDAFIKLIKLIIAPVVFCTVSAGIGHMSDLKKVGRVGGKALVYFEVVSTVALMIGLAAGLLVQPGRGFGIDPATLDPSIAADYAKRAAADTGWVDHLLHLIPATFVGAFADGDLLQILVLALITGFAVGRLGEFGAQVAHGIEKASKVFFSILHIVVHFAPIGAFGAMAFTVGKYGVGSLTHLFALIAAVYATSAVFIILVLGLITRWMGFSLFKFLRYLRDEILIVFGACASEAALPQLIEKLERLGASKPIVGLVVPAGYSFNLDGGNIYLTLAVVFLAQATNTELSFIQMATLIGVALLTSKGTAGVTGAGFITLAATLAVVPTVPIASLALLVGVDRFMAQCRGVTNFIGNGVAGLAVARWEGELDMAQLQTQLAAGPYAEPQAVEEVLEN
ncbi:MAG TPA: C4-dicarboxylate transporter DctA [Caulobacteraceae bacterium]|nr:C4-dicarboxylate transporter DctA [Caulobacteraceae bacterium]